MIFLAAFCCVLIFSSTSVSCEDDIELPASIPGTGYFQNATSVLKGFSQQFDSATKNFTMSPSSLFSRVRERFSARMERIKRRWLEARMKMGNRTLSMIERIVSRVDQKMEQMKPDKDGNETTATKMVVVLRAFLESLRNTVQGMVENLQTAAKEPVKWGEDAATSLKDAIEHEEPSSKAIKELNSALKKLDKETRDKFNDI